MGVGVSFSGHSGKRSFDLSGIPKGELAALLGRSKEFTLEGHKKKLNIPDNVRAALNPKPVDPTAAEKEGKVKLNALDPHPDTLDKKTMPGSAVTTSSSGLCLRGEEDNPSVVGTKFYGSHNGEKRYFGIGEIDRGDSPKRVGPLGAGKEGEDNDEGTVGQALAYQVASRLTIEEDTLGQQLLVEYDKDVETTSLGRTQKVTRERRRIVGILKSGSKAEESSVKGNFDPIFKDKVLSLVDYGVCPFGRRFTFMIPDVDSSAKIDEGLIYIEITHPTSNDPTPRFLIKGGPSWTFDGKSKDVTNIPLYRIKDGSITYDFRSCMSMVVRDI